MKKGSHGSFGAMNYERAEADYYRSPPDAMQMLLDSHPAPLTSGAIIDAGAGDGRLTRPLWEAGYKVMGVDIHDRGADRDLPILTEVDFLTDAALPTFVPQIECVVMNPPYILADAFIRRALEILPVGGTIHALLRHTWMNGKRRADLLPCLYQITLCGRLKMMPAGKEHLDKGEGGKTDFSWFSFQKGLDASLVHITHARKP